MGAKLEGDDKESVSTAVQEAIDWLEENQSADAEEYKDKLKEVEKIVNPILKKSLSSSTPGSTGGSDEEEDFGHEEL